MILKNRFSFARNVSYYGNPYMEAALKQRRTEGLAEDAADVARLSPLGHRHINLQGRYSFALAESVAQGALRPLRHPSDRSDEEEWETRLA